MDAKLKYKQLAERFDEEAAIFITEIFAADVSPKLQEKMIKWVKIEYYCKSPSIKSLV